MDQQAKIQQALAEAKTEALKTAPRFIASEQGNADYLASKWQKIASDIYEAINQELGRDTLIFDKATVHKQIDTLSMSFNSSQKGGSLLS